MDVYKDMYFRLFNKVSDIIGELQAIQAETEEMYMARDEDVDEDDEPSREPPE